MRPDGRDPLAWQRLADVAFPGARVHGVIRVEGSNFTDVYRVSLTSDELGRVDLAARVMRPTAADGLVGTLTRLLPGLRDYGVPVPYLRWADATGATLGRPVMVCDWISGDAYDSAPPLRQRVQEQAAVLAQIHSLPLHSMPLAATYPTAPTSHLRRWISETDAAEQVLRLVDRLVHGIRPTDDTLVHGDYWTGNLVWRRQALVGVLDWDAAAVGARGADVGKARLDLALRFGVKAAEDFSEHYQQLVGSAPDQGFWNLREALAGFPDPGLYWLPTYRALGSTDLSADLVRSNFADYIDLCLQAL